MALAGSRTTPFLSFLIWQSLGDWFPSGGGESYVSFHFEFGGQGLLLYVESSSTLVN